MIPLALSAPRLSEDGRRKKHNIRRHGITLGHSSSLIPSILLFLFPFDASAYNFDCGRNDLPLIDVTSHHSFMVLRLGNGELERFFVLCFPILLPYHRRAPSNTKTSSFANERIRALFAAHLPIICSLYLEFIELSSSAGQSTGLGFEQHSVAGFNIPWIVSPAKDIDQAQVSTLST